MNINDLSIINGSLPPRVYGFVVEWASIHKDELLDNWSKAKDLKTPKNIQPLLS